MSVSINGEGAKLWGVITVDTDRYADSTLQMWLANDEDHLREQILEEWLQDYEEDDWMKGEVEKQFEREWDVVILPKEIDMAGLMEPWVKL